MRYGATRHGADLRDAEAFEPVAASEKTAFVSPTRVGRATRPRVTITINGRPGRAGSPFMRGRYLLGLSNANRHAAGVETGDEVEVELEFDPEPRLVAEPVT
jgi:hypothetical protein